MPRIRTVPEDFEVEETLLYPPSGQGPHTWLWVEKRRRTTDDVLRSLAAALELPRREVGYAGRKDRLAVTRQWFSVPVTRGEQLAALKELEASDPGFRILGSERHSERLRVGEVRANRFRLTVREVDEASADYAREALGRLAVGGMPNRFGRQRFGRDGKNAERGARILESARLFGDRRRAWLMVSAFQSQVFNRVLERRSGALERLLQGDVAIVHATGDLFVVADPDAESERLARFEISATGPIFGFKMRTPSGEAAEIERQVMAEFDLPPRGPASTPRGLKLYGDRRPLRVQPRDAAAELRDDALELRFELPAGSYATVLLEELFPDGFEEGADRDSEQRLSEQ
ncbi:MAG: tRNA pseudouridine(13) synthase TruD [Thermoanaerobaculia bacterium]